MRPRVWTETIAGIEWRVQRVTGEIARILTGRNSYLAYRRVTPLPHEQAETDLSAAQIQEATDAEQTP